MKNWKTFKWASQPLTYHLTHTDNAINEKRQKKNHEKRNESEKNRFQGVLSVKIFYRREKK